PDGRSWQARWRRGTPGTTKTAPTPTSSTYPGTTRSLAASNRLNVAVSGRLAYGAIVGVRLCEGGRTPQPHCPVAVSRRCQDVAVGREGLHADLTRVPLEGEHFLPDREVPELDGVVAAGGERLAVRRNCHGARRSGREGGCRSPCGDVPERDASIGIAYGQG